MLRYKRGLIYLSVLAASWGASWAANAVEVFKPASREALISANAHHTELLQRIQGSSTSQSVQLIHIDVAALKRGPVELTLNNGLVVKTKKPVIEYRSSDDFTWKGKLTGVPGDAILVVNGDAVEGSVRHGTHLYKIETVGDGLFALIHIDQSKFPRDEPSAFAEIDRLAGDVEARIKAAGKVENSIASRTPVIEVQVNYTQSVETAKGSAAATAALIQLAIAETNLSYQNSNINAKLHLANTAKVTYDESATGWGTILSDYAGTSDGKMDSIHTTRNTYAADVSVLLINKSDSCGLANAILANASTAFALVHYSCATGNYSFGHEIGHLLGARHDVERDGSTTPFAYGHGFKNGSAWRTVMSYDCTPSCPRLQYWSNPAVKYGGVAMGTINKENNARVINTTAATVATFRNPDGTIWRYTGTPCSGSSCPGWQSLDNNGGTVTIAAGSSLYQLHNDGSVWVSTGVPCSGSSCPGWTKLDNNSKTIAIAAGGANLYQLHNDGMIWRYTGTPCSGSSCTGWQMLDNNPKALSIVASGSNLYQLHNDGMIWRYTGTPCSGSTCSGWQQLDRNAQTVAIATNDSTLYQLHSSGAIWRYTGTPCTAASCPGWQQLDNNANTKSIAAAGTALYQLHKDGRIWRYTGTPCSGATCSGWQQLDNNAASIGITAGGSSLYQLHNTGKVWRYTGTPCSGSTCSGWQMLDNNPKTKSIEAAGSALYQLHGN